MSVIIMGEINAVRYVEWADSLTFDQKVSAVTLSVHQQQADLHWTSVISSSDLRFQVCSSERLLQENHNNINTSNETALFC